MHPVPVFPEGAGGDDRDAAGNGPVTPYPGAGHRAPRRRRSPGADSAAGARAGTWQPVAAADGCPLSAEAGHTDCGAAPLRAKRDPSAGDWADRRPYPDDALDGGGGPPPRRPTEVCSAGWAGDDGAEPILLGLDT